MADHQSAPGLHSLLTRLLDDHQRMAPHHAHLCELCRDTKLAIDVAAGASPSEQIDDASLLASVDQCADRALAHRPQDEAPFYFTALLGHLLCHMGADVGVRLIDLVDAATLQPPPASDGLADKVLHAVEMAQARPADYRMHYFAGRLEGIMQDVGRPEVATAISGLFSPSAPATMGAPR